MSRPLRIEFPGAVYHVTSRGNERKDIFRDDVDRQIFLDLLGRCVQRYGWIVTAYVLMSNHYHLVIELTSATLSRGLHWLNGTYTQGFNKRHRRAGHLFQGRPHTPIIDKESYLLTVLRYVVLNPVRASMVPTPGEHFWSSYRSTAGLAPAPDWLRVDVALSPFCPDTTVAQAMYQDFVYAGIGLSARPWDELVGGIYLGSEPWLEKVRQRVESAPRDYEHPRPQRYVGKPAMPEVVRAVAESVNLDEDRSALDGEGFRGCSRPGSAATKASTPCRRSPPACASATRHMCLGWSASVTRSSAAIKRGKPSGTVVLKLYEQ